MWAFICDMQVNIGVALILVCGFMFLIFTILYGVGYVVKEKVKQKIRNHKETYESATSEVSSEPTVWEYEEWKTLLADPEGCLRNV